MATRRLGHNLLGVLSILIGGAALAATRAPLLGYGSRFIAIVGLAVGVLGFVLALVIGRWGSGTPALGIVFCLGVLALAGYEDGTLQNWMARLHPKQGNAQPSPAAPAAPRHDGGPPRVHSIFDSDDNSSPASSGEEHSGSAHKSAAVPPPAAAADWDTAPLQTSTQFESSKPVMSIEEARAKVRTAADALNRALAGNAGYQSAKAQADAAEARRNQALSASGPGSPEVVEASGRWIEARAKFHKAAASALAADPAAQAAQKELAAAQAAQKGLADAQAELRAARK
ncbi:MAG TPA: DUF308 domain-containing protein [Tepidisphaeraceae bacterium]|nr:DUF308 domain-containing protein [Tepidisphaeraceae bacterium]